MKNNSSTILKVARDTDPKRLAGTIKYNLEKDKYCEAHAMGPESIAVAVKSLALLKKIFKYSYRTMVDYIHFYTDDNKKRTGIKFMIWAQDD